MKKLSHLFAFISAVIVFTAVGVNAQSYAARTAAQTGAIEQKVYHELRKLPNYSVFDYIGFQVNGSTVTLTGAVYSLGTRSQAARYVKDIPGVSNVVNQIVDLPPSPFDDSIRRQAVRTFAAHGLSGYLWEINPDVHIVVQNGHVTLEGFVMNSGDKNAMNIYANSIPGVFSVENHLVVGKPIYR